VISPVRSTRTVPLSKPAPPLGSTKVEKPTPTNSPRGIVLDAGARGIRKLIGLDKIFPAYFQTVHSQNRGGFVEQPLDIQHRLRPAGAAIGTGRASIGKHRDDFHTAVFDLIAAAGHTEHALRWSCGARVEVSAEVGDDFDFQAENFPVFSKRHLRGHRLIAALNRGDKIFAARGDPLDRLAQFEREMASDDIFAVNRSFATEAAADVRRDQMNFMLGKPQSIGDLGARAMRPLGGKPYGEVFTKRVRAGDDTAWLHRQRDLPRAGDVHGENMVRDGERLIDVAAVFDHRVTDIAVDFFARERRTWLKRRFRIRYSG